MQAILGSIILFMLMLGVVAFALISAVMTENLLQVRRVPVTDWLLRRLRCPNRSARHYRSTRY
jgi:hypothetical protein